MFAKRWNEQFFNISSVSFLFIVIGLVLFSVVYADLRYSGITGLQSGELPAVDPIPGSCSSTGVCSSSNNPPEQVLDGVSRNVEVVSQSKSYVSDIISIIETNDVTESDLERYRKSIKDALDGALIEYENVKDLAKGYSSNSLSDYQESIVKDLAFIEKSYSILERDLLEVVVERQEFQRQEAIWVLDNKEQIENSVSKLVEYSYELQPLDSIESEDYVSKFNDFVINYVEGNPMTNKCINEVNSCVDSFSCLDYISECILNNRCDLFVDSCLIEKQEEQVLDVEVTCSGEGCDLSECVQPSYLTATDINFDNFGGYGVNALTGKICYIGNLNVYSAPTSTIDFSESVSPDTPSFDSSSLAKKDVKVIYFQNNDEGGGRNYVASVLTKDKNGNLNINLFNSPDFYDLEKEIEKFINDLLFKNKRIEDSYISGMSVEEADSIVYEYKFFPWVLWSVLLMMITTFLLFGNSLSSHYTRLIYLGTNALNSKDYSLAIRLYNQLAMKYPFDLEVRQEVLDYLHLLKQTIGSDLNLRFFEDDSLPRIESSSLFVNTGDYYRVQNMIIHALGDLKDSPEISKARMPIIAQEYKNLNSKDRERLAPYYESLVFKLRDLDG